MRPAPWHPNPQRQPPAAPPVWAMVQPLARVWPPPVMQRVLAPAVPQQLAMLSLRQQEALPRETL